MGFFLLGFLANPGSNGPMFRMWTVDCMMDYCLE
jgi:hypothetical protein